MFLYIATVTLSTVFCIIAFLIALNGDYKKFYKHFGYKNRRLQLLPIISSTGAMVNTVEDLQNQIEVLKSQYDQKEHENVIIKSKIAVTQRHIDELSQTTSEIKKYECRLRASISSIESERKTLKRQIEHYRQIYDQVRKESGKVTKKDIDERLQFITADYEVIESFPENLTYESDLNVRKTISSY